MRLAMMHAAVGDPLMIDELVPDVWYGLRQPGERRVYEVTRAPDASLAAIAAQVHDSSYTGGKIHDSSGDV